MRLAFWHRHGPEEFRAGRRGAPGTLSWRVLTDEDDLVSVAAPWSELLSRSDGSEPTMTPEWLRTWWRVFGALDGRRLRFGLLHEGKRLVAIAPLLTRRHWYRPGVPFRRLELLGTGEDEADEICSDYVGIVAERGAEERVAAAFAGALAEGVFGSWDELVLDAMKGDSSLPKLLSGALGRLDSEVHLDANGAAPYVALPASWEAYLAALSGSSRYLVRRSLRDFEAWADGTASFETARTRADFARGKRILVELHGERWRGAGRAGVFASPRFTAFHDAILPQLFERGALELSWLSVRGEPVAAIYNIVWNNKVYFYQSGRKPELPQKLRPGIVLHAHAIQRAIEAGRSEYDFLAGASRYKLALGTSSRSIVALRASRNRTLERARAIAEREMARLGTLFVRNGAPPSPGAENDSETDDAGSAATA